MSRRHQGWGVALAFVLAVVACQQADNPASVQNPDTKEARAGSLAFASPSPVPIGPSPGGPIGPGPVPIGPSPGPTGPTPAPSTGPTPNPNPIPTPTPTPLPTPTPPPCAGPTFDFEATGLPVTFSAGGQLFHPVTVSGVTGNICRVTVDLFIEHPKVAELAVDIVVDTPGILGIHIFLADLVGEGPPPVANFGSGCTVGQRTVFDDFAQQWIGESGLSDFTGTFQPGPQQPNSLELTKVVGFLESKGGVNGEWKLRILNDFFSTAVPGTLHCWAVHFQVE